MGFSYSASFPSSPSHLLHGSNRHSLLAMSSIPLPLNLRPSSNLLLKLPPLQTHRSVARLPRASAAKFQVRASGGDAPPASSDGKLAIFGSAAVTVAFAVANRVLYKLALVPMKQYPFFLAQVTTFGYVAIYFSILYVRNRVGIVTGEMLALPKSRFVAIGMLEALGVVTGMSAGAMLPGPAIPILSQTFLVWQLTFSTVLLGRKYSFNQIAGCLLVAAGVVVAIASGSNSGQNLSGIEFAWPLVMIASSAFQAGASIIKEYIFIDAARRLKGKSLDIFVVNSFGSGFQEKTVFGVESDINSQSSDGDSSFSLKKSDSVINLRLRNSRRPCYISVEMLSCNMGVLIFLLVTTEYHAFLDTVDNRYMYGAKRKTVCTCCHPHLRGKALFVFLFLPFLSNLKGIPFAQLPLYLKEGAGCFLNIGANTTGCDGAPWLPLIFVTTNIIFNISLLNLVKMSSAVVASLAVVLSVPISIYVLSRPLPYLPEGASLSPFFVIGGITLVLGLMLYNVPQRHAAKSD